MLQPAQVGRGLGHSGVTDALAVAEGQAAEAAAAARYRHQAGVADLAQRAQGQALQVRVAHHLRRGAGAGPRVGRGAADPPE